MSFSGTTKKQEDQKNHADEVATLVKKLAPHRDDLEKILSIIGGKSSGGCFVYSPALAERIQREAGVIRQIVPYIQTRLKQQPPDVANARNALGQVDERLTAIQSLLGKDAKLLTAFMTKYVYDVLESRIASAESK